MRRWFDRFLMFFALMAAGLAFAAQLRQWQRSVPIHDATIVAAGPRLRCGNKTHCTEINIRAQGQERTGRFEESIFVTRPSVGMALPLRASQEDGVMVFRTGKWHQAFLAWLLLGLAAMVATATFFWRRRRNPAKGAP